MVHGNLTKVLLIHLKKVRSGNKIINGNKTVITSLALEPQGFEGFFYCSFITVITSYYLAW